MSKHTPGPWEIYEGVMVRTHDDIAISHCGDCFVDGDASLSEAQANARLISAAPCLLEACEAALSASVRMWGTHLDGDSKTGALHAQLRAAIAKATGQPTHEMSGGAHCPPGTAEGIGELVREQTVCGGGA